MIYLLTFAISSFLCEAGFRERNRKVFCILVGLALFLPAFLAGARDITIGTDRLVYGDDLFYDVQKSQDFLHLDSKWTGWIETGYVYLNYFVGKIYPDVQFFYFVLSFIEGLCVVLTLHFLKVKKYAGLAYALYLFVLFQPALNALRQCLSVAVLLLGVTLLLKNRKFLGVFLWLLALSFHNSAVIGLFIPFIMLFLRRYHGMKSCILMSAIMLAVLACGDMLVNTFAPILNMEASRYSHYFDKSDVTGFSNTEMCFALFQAVFIFLNYKRFRGNSLTLNFFVFVSVASIPLSEILMFGGDYIGRLIILFNWLMVPAYAIVMRVSKKKGIVALGLIAYMLSFWYYHYIYMGWHQTFPYTSAILGLN